jgi:hypothetical protein
MPFFESTKISNFILNTDKNLEIVKETNSGPPSFASRVFGKNILAYNFNNDKIILMYYFFGSGLLFEKNPLEANDWVLSPDVNYMGNDGFFLPPVAFSECYCFDSINNTIYSYYNDGSSDKYLSSCNLDTYTWTDLTDINIPNIGSYFYEGFYKPQMVWDFKNSVLLIYGKNPASDLYLLYEYNPTTNVWTNKSIYGTVNVDYPTYVEGGGFVYDSKLEEVILTHGYNLFSGASKNTWSFNGTSWVNKTVSGTSGVDYPEARFQTYCSLGHNGKIYMFGGTSAVISGVDYKDVWEWDSSADSKWTKITTNINITNNILLAGKYRG